MYYYYLCTYKECMERERDRETETERSVCGVGGGAAAITADGA